MKDFDSRPVLWIVTELFPPDETSTAYILGEIANAMTRKYRVGVICGPEVYDKCKDFEWNSTFRINPAIRIIRADCVDVDKNKLWGKAVRFFVMSRRLVKLAKEHIRPQDKVLMVTNPAPLVVAMARLKRKRGFRLNILVHDVFPENTKPAGLKIPAILYNPVKRIFDRAYSQADLLIALGRDMKNVLEGKVGRHNPNLRVEVIENWGDVAGITPQPFPEGKIILQYAGNIGRVQGLDKVMEELPDEIEFHLYGTGAMEEVLKSKNRQNVFFHGPYLRSEQTAILGACDIALVTLESGMYGLGVPSKTYNILAAGRPVLFLGPENSEIDRLVRENKIGYCSWPSHWERHELEEMGQRARALAIAEYAKDAILSRFLNVI